MSIWWTIGAFILVLTPIILIHELGHFIAARLSGIRVEEFGLGFPPRALTLFKRGETIYSLNWIPVGGFVRPAGEDDPSVPGGLAAASKKARLFTLSAGAAANFIFALAILWVAFMIGEPKYGPTVSQVVEGSPAAVAGLQGGDIVLEVNGQSVSNSTELRDEIYSMAGQELAFLVRRGNEEITLLVQSRAPGEFEEGKDGPTGISIADQPTGEKSSNGPVESINLAAGTVFDVIWGTIRAPLMVIQGQISASEARPVSVVGISQLAGRAAEETANRRDWFPILWFSAVISVALGFTNLLPIPALDGGRIMFVIVEAIRGRRVEPEREGMVHLVGMLVLLGLMVLIIIQDIVNPIIPF